jgi:hypothetical protein
MALNASRTCSSLKGLMIAIMYFIRLPLAVGENSLSRRVPVELFY